MEYCSRKPLLETDCALYSKIMDQHRRRRQPHLQACEGHMHCAVPNHLLLPSTEAIAIVAAECGHVMRNLQVQPVCAQDCRSPVSTIGIVYSIHRGIQGGQLPSAFL